MRRLTGVVSVLIVLAACGGGDSGGKPPPPAVEHRSVTIGGQERPYRVFIPPTLDRTRPAPLVVVLHGGANTVEDMVKTTGFDRQASVGEFIVAYPEATLRAWNAGKCCGSAPRRNPDDVGFITMVLDELEADFVVDRSRVFLTGVSNGAMMAYRYACERAERVTAVGVVAGSVMVDDCKPSRPVSVLEIHGTEDQLIPYLGGTPSAPEAADAPPYTATAAMMQRWAEVNGCPAATAPTVGGPVSVDGWSGCHAGAQVKLITVRGGGHTWFASGLGPANGSLDATSAIWQFFADLRPTG